MTLRMLTVPEVAETLQVSEDTVYRHIASGALRSCDVSAGRRSVTRVREAALDEFIAKRENKRAAA